MSELQLQERWGFNHDDLAANRLGRLTEKQQEFLTREYKSQRSVFRGVGIVIALLFCCLPILVFGGRVFPTLISDLQFFNLPGTSTILTTGGPVFAAIALVISAVLLIYFLLTRRKADLVVRKAEGTVDYVWETKRVRIPGTSVRTYEDVRVLILRVGPEHRFEVNEQLQSMILEGEEWAIYYTSYPFKFLSAERL